MDKLLPWYLRFWKIELGTIVVIVAGCYVTSLQRTIDSDHIMLDAAHNQLVKMSAEYKADVEQMTQSIKTQNILIDELQKSTELAKQQLAAATYQSTLIKQSTDRQVNAILARPYTVGCDSSIMSAISYLPELSWDKIK